MSTQQPDNQQVLVCPVYLAGRGNPADFTNRTPMYLVAETARAFSSTAPVERQMSGISQRNLPYITASPAPRPDPDRRRSAALARTPRVLPAALAAPTGTTTPDPTSPPPFRRR